MSTSSTSDAPAGECFYEPVDPGAGEAPRFRATELTRGPWDGDSQHAGPPAALLARALERHPASGDGPRQIGRITYEILRPIPITSLAVEVETLRPGRRVELLEATLRDPGGEPLVSARGWRLAKAATEIPAGLTSTEPGSPPQLAGRPGGASGPPPGPSELEPAGSFLPSGYDRGYHTAMEYRFASGAFDEPGPAMCWMRMRVPLLVGEEPSPLQRVLVAADSGNGISSTLDFHRFLFINVDLTVHLHRMPAGEWVGIDALTIPEPTGNGSSDALLHDERGPIGRACQTLLVSAR